MKKHAIITGAAGGLGTAVTRQFLAANYHVTGCTQPGEDEQIIQLEELGVQSVQPLDVLDEATVQEFAQESEEAVEALVLIVGGFAMGGLADTTAADLEKMIRLNVFSAYHMARAFWSRLEKAESGKVVLIGAKPALDPEAGAGLMAYTLSKGMVFHLAELLNQTGKDSQTQAVVIAPSIIDTEANREAMPDANFSDWVTPEAIGKVIVQACEPSPLREQVLKVFGNS